MSWCRGALPRMAPIDALRAPAQTYASRVFHRLPREIRSFAGQNETVKRTKPLVALSEARFDEFNTVCVIGRWLAWLQQLAAVAGYRSTAVQVPLANKLGASLAPKENR